MNRQFFTSKTFLARTFPLLLLGLLLLAGLITVITQASKYGITLDEPLQDNYGHAILAWYRTLGRDKSFLTAFPPDTFMPEHGGFFDAIIAFAQHLFPAAAHWEVRRIITGLAGLLGLVAIALCGYELGGYWVAFLSALALWLYPRYEGAIYNNPKDIPAAVTTTFVLWGALLLIKHWGNRRLTLRNSILVGFFIGVAAAIRVNSLIWYGILLVMLAGWWALRGRQVWREKLLRAVIVNQVVAVALMGITSLLTMMALWPYVFLNPIGNLYHSIVIISKYPWDGTVLYNGTVYLAPQLPRTYVPTWLAIASPPLLLLFALVGLGIVLAEWVRQRRIEPKMALVLLSFAVPLATIVGLHAVLYDGLRQFIFLIPPLILVAVYGFVWTVRYLAHREQKLLKVAAGVVIAVTLVSYLLVAVEMVRLAPFEYAYFSPVIGGLPGAYGRFDTDYWDTCETPAAQWLNQHYQQYTSASTPTVNTIPYPSVVAPTLAPAFHENRTNPDFVIAATRDNADQQYPNYTVIHTVSVEGVPLCVVKMNPTLAQAAKAQASSTSFQPAILSSTSALPAGVILTPRWLS